MNIYEGAAGIEDIVSEVLDYGVEIPNSRTNTSTRAIFDAKIVIYEGDFPFTNSLLASPRLAFEELWFFLNGRTQTKELEEKGVNFWKGNTSKEFQESVGLGHLQEGDLGAAYSAQWRNFGGNGVSGAGADQLAELVHNLRVDRYSRRHYVTLWNPLENEFGVLTPCWHSCQFVVLPDRHGNDELHLKLVNRSLDILFGARFALMQYRMLQMALCRMFGFKLGVMSCDLSHVHLYENQYEYARELIGRHYGDSDNNYIRLGDWVEINTLRDLLSLTWEDWEMTYEYNREPFKTKRPEMVA